MLQDEYRKLYSKINPNWTDSVTLYKNLVRGYITKDTVLLEAGCGFSNNNADLYKEAKKVIGVDSCKEFLKMNITIPNLIHSSLTDIPSIKDSSIDLIISSWVFEHVSDPSAMISEFKRILKPKGKIIFLTPNKLNYIIIANRFFPNFIKKYAIKKISENLTVDPMKTFYRFNSKKDIENFLYESGLILKKILFNGDPTYIAINQPFFYLGILIEKILNIFFLEKFKTHIIGIIEKQ